MCSFRGVIKKRILGLHFGIKDINDDDDDVSNNNCVFPVVLLHSREKEELEDRENAGDNNNNKRRRRRNRSVRALATAATISPPNAKLNSCLFANKSAPLGKASPPAMKDQGRLACA